MKKIAVLAMALVSAVVNASEVVVMEASLPVMNEARALVDARFYMNPKTGEGFVKASVSEERFTGIPEICTFDRTGYCFPQMGSGTQVVVFSDKEKIEGLMLMGDQAVYHSAESNVVCGTMGVSRIFKVPTLYLNGNCKLESKIVRKDHFSNKLIITLKTK